MNKKGFAAIAVVLVALLVACGVWYYHARQADQSVVVNSTGTSDQNPPCCKNDVGVASSTTVTPSMTSSARAPASSSTYSNGKYGFAIDIPSDYTFVVGNVSSSGGYLGPMVYDQTSNFFAVSTGTAVVLGGFNVPPSVYASTTETDALVGISVNPAITDSVTCNEFLGETSADGPDAPHPEGTLVVNNITYSEADLGEGAAMMHSEGLTILHTFQNGICYEVLLDQQTAYGYEVMPPDWDSTGALRGYLSGISYSIPQ